VALYLNDYDVELQGRAKSVAYYNLAVRLKNAGIPIEGVGLQCHFSLGKVDSVKLDATIRRFGEAGLKCIITELDMGMDAFTKATLEEQARNYRVITDIVLNNANCPNMVIWGIKDNDSWRSAVYPLLYTSALVKKPAFFAVRSALRHRTLHPETSVPFVRSTGGHKAAPVFDLSGRQVQEPHLRPGIYIRGGKKMVIR
jgi:GH35 family endo-1,4-beta-xylanase